MRGWGPCGPGSIPGSPTSKEDMKLKSPAVLLFFLSAIIGEVLSGATGPLTFFTNPIIFIFLTIFYGSGALIIRELSFKWGKGWPTIVTLGVIYAIIEEGILTKVFFDPTRQDLSPLVNYGSLFGVNWNFALFLVIYHSVVSISVPIILTKLIFPENKSWISGKTFKILSFLFIAEIILGSLIFPYKLLPLQYLLLISAIIVLYRIAKKLPNNFSSASRLSSERFIYFLGFVFVIGLFFSWIMTSLKILPIFIFAYLLALSFFAVKILLKFSNEKNFTNSKQLALASGILTPFILVSFIQELIGRTGMSLIGIGMALFLFWIYKSKI